MYNFSLFYSSSLLRGFFVRGLLSGVFLSGGFCPGACVLFPDLFYNGHVSDDFKLTAMLSNFLVRYNHLSIP